MKQDESPRFFETCLLGAPAEVLHPNHPPDSTRVLLGHAELIKESSSNKTSVRASSDRKIEPVHLGRLKDKQQKRCLSTAGIEYFCVENQRDTVKSLQRSGTKRRFALLFNKNRFRHIFHSSEDVCAGHGEIANFLDKEANFSY